jgi:hypothetical protein
MLGDVPQVSLASRQPIPRAESAKDLTRGLTVSMIGLTGLPDVLHVVLASQPAPQNVG